ncbi:MAG: VOC family protein [Actinobacteria bacterium]|nr:MAG: VOC family protein [Actinomycetota bacterium]
MDVLSSRVLLRPTDPERSRHFYGELLSLAVYREYGQGRSRGVVYFLGGGFLEVAGRSDAPGGDKLRLWLQVRDVDATYRDLVGKGVEVTRPPTDEPWGLREMWLADPDGVPIVVVEVPEDHPLRRRQ